jgi:hypothetical protein
MAVELILLLWVSNIKCKWGGGRKIFGPKKDEVSDQFQILHNKELQNFHRPFNIYLFMVYFADTVSNSDYIVLKPS